MARTANHEAVGKTDEHGILRIYNRELLDEFMKKHPNRVIEMEFVAVGDKHSDPMRRYYFVEPVAKIQKALKGLGYEFDRQETHEFCKTISPVTRKEIEIVNRETGEITVKYKPISLKRLTNEDFLDYIEDLKRWAAQELHIIINDPEI